MLLSEKVQVKLNLLENFEFKILQIKDEGWSLQKKFKFFRPAILKRSDEV